MRAIVDGLKIIMLMGSTTMWPLIIITAVLYESSGSHR
jgi:hypothetical protein